MKRNLNCIFFITLALASFSCTRTQNENTETNALSQIQINKIDSIGQSILGRGNNIGFSIAIAYNGEIVFAKGYGYANVITKQLATENTIYPIASVSKFITSAATLKMIDENKISLEDKIIDFFPEFPRQQYMEDITIEHLLRHQSGLVDNMHWFDSIYNNHDRIATTTELFEFLDQPLLFQPGTMHLYSNTGFAILSEILEMVSGQAYHDVIIHKIAKPTGMESLGLWPKMWHQPNATMGYEIKNNSPDTSFQMMMNGLKGAGGLSASVIDLVKFTKALQENKLISETSLAKLLTPTQISSLSVDYGLGVRLGEFSNNYGWGHSGGYSGTGWAIVNAFPESGFTFAAAINTSFSPDDAWALRGEILPIIFGVDPQLMNTGTIENVDQYIGEYALMDRWGSKNGSIRIVTVDDGKLIWDNPETKTPGARLYPIGNQRFTWEAFPFDEFKFHTANGKIIACSEYYEGFFISVRMKK